MTQILLGYYKLVEEMGELNQVFGKIGAFPTGAHPDGGRPLVERLEEELADVQAALTYMIQANNLDADKIEKRFRKKLSKYHEWVLSGIVEEDRPVKGTHYEQSAA